MYEYSFKEYFPLKKNHSVYTNIDNLPNENSFLFINKRKKILNGNNKDNSLIRTNNKNNSLNKSTRSTKINKFIHNISSQYLDNYKSKSKYQNTYAISQPNQRSLPNSVVNSIKKKKKMSITFLKKNDKNKYSQISLKKDANLKLHNNLKLSSEFNYKNKKTKESISSYSKRETYIESNRSNNKNISYIKMSISNSNLFDSQFIIKKIGVNKDKKAKENAYTNRTNSVHFSDKIEINKDFKNLKIKKTPLKDIIIQNDQIKYNKEENKKKLSKDISIKLYSKVLSNKNKDNIYSQKYSKKRFLNKNNNNSISSKNILPKIKDLNNELIKKDNINSKNYNNLNDNNRIDKKITVNLNAQNTRIKNNKNIHINMNLINLPSQNQNIFSPVPSIFTQSHEKSLSILSSKNFKKKGDFVSKDNRNKSIESSNNYNNNNDKNITSESSELSNIVSSMNNEIKKYKKNSTSFYLNGERNFFCSPDGPEDFHFRFVELCKQNDSFFRNLKSNIENKENQDKTKKDSIKECLELDNKQYFENFEEDVPYI